MRTFPRVRAGQLSQADAATLNEALGELEWLLNGFHVSPPLSKEDSPAGRHVWTDEAATTGGGTTITVEDEATPISVAGVNAILFANPARVLNDGGGHVTVRGAPLTACCVGQETTQTVATGTDVTLLFRDASGGFGADPEDYDTDAITANALTGQFQLLAPFAGVWAADVYRAGCYFHTTGTAGSSSGNVLLQIIMAPAGNPGSSFWIAEVDMPLTLAAGQDFGFLVEGDFINFSGLSYIEFHIIHTLGASFSIDDKRAWVHRIGPFTVN